MPDAGQEGRQTTDGVGEISDARKSIEAAVKDPFAFAVVLVITVMNTILLGARDYFLAKLNTLNWLIVISLLVLVITGIGYCLLRARKRITFSTRLIRRTFLVGGVATAMATAAIGWWIHLDSRATIESVADISSPGLDCSGELPKIDFDNPPKAPYCLPLLQQNEGGSERLVKGTVGGRVSGDLWLEVHTPTQRWLPPDLPEQSIQEKPQWFYSPVIEEKSGAWKAYATIGWNPNPRL